MLRLTILVLLAVGSLAHAQEPSSRPVEPKKPVAKEKAPLVAVVGKLAPEFVLKDLAGKSHRLSSYRKKVVVLEWFNPGCPWVKLHHERNRTMAETSAKFAKRGVVWLAINSGAPGKQGHGAALNKKIAKDWKINYPMLTDESGAVGRRYAAKTTPHMYIIDTKGKLVYAGAIDNRKTIGSDEHVNHVDTALTALLAGKAIGKANTKPYGCSVKYGPRPKTKAPALSPERREAILKRLRERRKKALEAKKGADQ
jgi:peroxiredoxin